MGCSVITFTARLTQLEVVLCNTTFSRLHFALLLTVQCLDSATGLVPTRNKDRLPYMLPVVTHVYLLSVFMSPCPLSCWLLLLLLGLMMGMLWLAGAVDGAGVCSSSESLLLEPLSLLEDEELLEPEELSLLLSWSMTCASAINSVQ